MEPRTSVSVLKMLGAYKKVPQAYFLYVEDCFLLSDNADAPSIFKSLDFELPYLNGKILNTPLILLRNLTYFLHGIVDLHRAGCHLVHAFGDDAGKVVEFTHLLRDTFAAF